MAFSSYKKYLYKVVGNTMVWNVLEIIKTDNILLSNTSSSSIFKMSFQSPFAIWIRILKIWLSNYKWLVGARCFPQIKFSYIQIMYMVQILNHLPFNSSEIIHISHITSGHLGDLSFNYEFGFSFGETNP